jgi:hypothetical protein
MWIVLLVVGAKSEYCSSSAAGIVCSFRLGQSDVSDVGRRRKSPEGLGYYEDEQTCVVKNPDRDVSIV